MNTTVIHPESIHVDLDDGNIVTKVLSEKHIDQWRNEGYLLINNLFKNEIVKLAMEELVEFVSISKNDFCSIGAAGALEYPTGLSSLDALSISPILIKAIQQLLNRHEIRLSQAETWKKVGPSSNNPSNLDDVTYSNQDQRMHMDFPNHTLLHPPPFDQPEAVACIIYLSDSKDCGGATNIVPRNGTVEDDKLYQWPYSNMPGFGPIPWINDRTCAEKYLLDNYPDVALFREELYKRERSITFQPGTILFYRHDLWHRGTPLLPNSVRFVQNLVYKVPNCDWLNNWNQGPAKNMYRIDQYNEKHIAKLNIYQRNCLGIPLPGHSYWTPLTIEAVAKRYSIFGMDMTPYIEAMKPSI